MLKNKEFKWMILAATVLTVAVSICGSVLYGGGCAVLSLLLGGAITAFFVAATRKRYRDLDALNLYLEKVLAGGEAPNILDQEEGELSMLRTNIYKATSTLRYQKELLLNDKVALANAIADISHQLKTPLTSMIVMNDLLKTEESETKKQEFLKTQSAQLDRMNWLIQTLLKLSKMDAGTITMNPERVEAKKIVSEMLKPFEIQMDIKNIKCVRKVGDISLKCDRNWTIEALQNIVKNCIEHMEEGDSLSVVTNETNIYTEIIITDTGCGISEEDLPHIFERFYKGRNAGKDSVGIGLALAKTIMTSQHGDILVESKEGSGTTFNVRLYKTII